MTKYYVLVGHQDGLGRDQYRPVEEKEGNWEGGGGDESNFNPNVYDILAETTEEQYQQLSWELGSYATLQPVGGGSQDGSKILIIVLIAVVVATLLYFFTKIKAKNRNLVFNSKQ